MMAQARENAAAVGGAVASAAPWTADEGASSERDTKSEARKSHKVVFCFSFWFQFGPSVVMSCSVSSRLLLSAIS